MLIDETPPNRRLAWRSVEFWYRYRVVTKLGTSNSPASLRESARLALLCISRGGEWQAYVSFCAPTSDWTRSGASPTKA